MEFLTFCRRGGATVPPQSVEVKKTKPAPKVSSRHDPQQAQKPPPELEPQTPQEPTAEEATSSETTPVPPKKKAGRPPGAKTNRNRVGKVEKELMLEQIEREIKDKLVQAEADGKLEKETNRIRTRLKLIREVTSKHKKPSLKQDDVDVPGETD